MKHHLSSLAVALVVLLSLVVPAYAQGNDRMEDEPALACITRMFDPECIGGVGNAEDQVEGRSLLRFQRRLHLQLQDGNMNREDDGQEGPSFDETP